MTRYKELRRLERAIDDKNEHELQWALSWCKSRLSRVTTEHHMSSAMKKHHKKHWMRLIERVRSTLDEMSG